MTAFAELQAHAAFGQDEDGPIDEWDGNDRRPATSGCIRAGSRSGTSSAGCGGLSARIGRQEVVLGNQFQFGNADWYNGVVHDGLRVDWKGNCWA